MAAAEAAQEVDPIEAAEQIVEDMGLYKGPSEDDDAEEAGEPEPESPEEDGDEAAAASDEEASDEEEGEPEEKPEKVDAEWAKTPEGIAAKVKEVEEREALLEKERTDFQRKWDATERREKKLRVKVDKWKKAQEEFRVTRDWVTTNIAALRNGDAAQRIQALGALTGRPGHEVYEELTIGLVSDGKTQGRESQEMQELRSTVAELKNYIASQQAGQRQHSAVQREQAWRSHVVDLATQQSEQMPHVGRLAAQDPGFLADQAAGIAQIFYRQHGQPIDPAKIPAILEQRLAIAAGASNPAQPSGEGAATSEVGTDREPVAQAKPGTAPRSPKGQSIPQSSGSAARKRPLTDQERLKAAEDFLPPWLASLQRA